MPLVVKYPSENDRKPLFNASLACRKKGYFDYLTQKADFGWFLGYMAKLAIFAEMNKGRSGDLSVYPH